MILLGFPEIPRKDPAQACSVCDRGSLVYLFLRINAAALFPLPSSILRPQNVRDDIYNYGEAYPHSARISSASIPQMRSAFAFF